VKSRKTSIRFDPDRPAMSIFKSRYWSRHMVYILRASKRVKYTNGSSHVIYIGETRLGNRRPASSAASKARQAFDVPKRGLRGVRQIDVYPLTFRGKQSVKIWEVLERDLLATFNKMYDDIPRYNHQGRGFSTDNIAHFRRKRLENILMRLA
jgi:hypothetical protein